MTTVIDLLRHAETALNANRAIIGGRSVGIPLSTPGIVQAYAAGQTLAAIQADEGWSYQQAYASGALRTLETMAEVGRSIFLPDRKLDERLLEISAGQAEGRQAADVWDAPTEERLAGDPLNFKLAPNAESNAEVQTRMVAAVTDIAAAHPGERVLICSHGAAIRNLVWALTDCSVEDFSGFSLPNVSVTRLVFDNDACTVEFIGQPLVPKAIDAAGSRRLGM